MSLKTDKNYLAFIGATTTSAIGSFAFNFAFMSYLYFATGNDKRFVALSQLFFVVGMLLGNITGGNLGDKLDKKRILFICEAIRIPLVSLMLVFHETIWPLLILHGVKTYFAGISTPIKRAYISSVVSKADVSSANMGFTISYSVTQIIGPFLGTWIYFYVKSLETLIILDVLTFIISTLIIFFLKSAPSKLLTTSKRFIEDLKDGIKCIQNSASHKGLFTNHIIVGFLSGFLIPLVLPFTVEALNATEKTYGILMALFGVGGILGAIVSKKLNENLGVGKTIYTLCMIEPIIFLLWINVQIVELNICIFFLWGALFFARATSQFNYISKKIDSAFSSRVNALFDFVFTATNICSVTFISLNGKLFNTVQFLQTIALIYLGLNITLFFTSRMKEFRHG